MIFSNSESRVDPDFYNRCVSSPLELMCDWKRFELDVFHFNVVMMRSGVVASKNKNLFTQP